MTIASLEQPAGQLFHYYDDELLAFAVVRPDRVIGVQGDRVSVWNPKTDAEEQLRLDWLVEAGKASCASVAPDGGAVVIGTQEGHVFHRRLR